ncbi:SMI1/KNR4 family protein [Sediminibacterium goheungense]|uniref:SUKH superfamily protein n=1 Tax=Sediminibacterium goheungense TaxID=1086393 RepID=A0A4R6IWA4_9BACT|nr:SMI1/KNR4 family protein [Sediminibacterium goheungense]TDO26983.1 SUKH superfamily protein [Sediminibacterium goheungense]
MKEDGIDTIWQVPKYLPYVQPNLTEDIIANAEKKIGYKLPKEYIDILRIQNGGYIRFRLPETLHEQIYGIGPFFPSLTDYDWTDYEGTVGFELNGLIPFDGDGHWYLCLDYRQGNTEPEVTFIDTESDYEKPIATNFKEYLQLLEINTDNAFVIAISFTIQELVAKISSIAGIEFEEPNSFDHGYPIYRSKYNESWVWISPNKVPAGFIRESDDRYEELKSQKLQISLRHPEISGDFFFITVSEDLQRENLFAILAEHGIKINEAKTYFE